MWIWILIAFGLNVVFTMVLWLVGSLEQMRARDKFKQEIKEVKELLFESHRTTEWVQECLRKHIEGEEVYMPELKTGRVTPYMCWKARQIDTPKAPAIEQVDEPVWLIGGSLD